MYLEREAFTYSKVDGAAIKLLNKFCNKIFSNKVYKLNLSNRYCKKPN